MHPYLAYCGHEGCLFYIKNSCTHLTEYLRRNRESVCLSVYAYEQTNHSRSSGIEFSKNLRRNRESVCLRVCVYVSKTNVPICKYTIEGVAQALFVC